MRRHTPRRPLALITLAATLVALAPRPAADAASVRLDARLTVVADGSTPFDPGAPPPTAGGAGLDAGPDNGVVRSNDSVVYRVDWSANEASATSVVATVTLSPGQSWAALPSACATSGPDPSSIVGARLRCSIGTTGPGGATGTFDATARIGVVANGTPLSADLDLSAPTAVPARALAPRLTASAAPRVNLRQAHAWVNQSLPVADPAGRPGRVFYFPITVEVPGTGRGAEPLSSASPLRFREDLSALPPSATLAGPTWVRPSPDEHAQTCGAQDRLVYGVPYGRLGVANGASTSANSVTDSGAWTCSYDPVGRAVDVTVTGADLAPVTSPRSDSMNAPLGRTVLAAGQVAIWISEADLTAFGLRPGGAVPPVRVSWTSTPTGVSGVPATGENPNDDQQRAVIQLYQGDYDSFYAGDLGLFRADVGFGTYTAVQPTSPLPNTVWYPFVPTQSNSTNTGDGRVVPGQRFGLVVSKFNRTDRPAYVAACAQLSPGQRLRNIERHRLLDYGVVDTDAVLAGRPPIDSVVSDGPTTGSPVVAVTTVHVLSATGYAVLAPSTIDSDIAVDYSTRAHVHDGDCGATADWSTSPPADLATVTQVRVRTRRPIVTGEVMTAYVALTADPTPAGTQVWTTTDKTDWVGAPDVPADATWAGRGPGYDPAQWCSLPDHGPDPSFNDCLTVEAAQLGIARTVTSNPTVGLRSGDVVDVRIEATVHGQVGATARRTIVTDELPAGLEPVDSGRPAPARSGRTLTWVLGDVPYGEARVMTYRARVTGDAGPRQVLAGTARVTAETDVGDGTTDPLPSASATSQVQTAGPLAELRIQKSTPTPVIGRDGTMEFDLSYRNTGTVPDVDARFVDVLPFNGDGRSAPSSFTGRLRLAGVDAPDGHRVRYTSRPPASIAADPDDVSNRPGGSTVWCEDPGAADDPSTPDLGERGCPAALAEATAVLVEPGAPIAPGEAFDVRVTLATSGNDAGDVYTNQFDGRVANIALPVRSNAVTVRVGVAATPSTLPVRPSTPTASSTPGRTPSSTSGRGGRGDGTTASRTSSQPWDGEDDGSAAHRSDGWSPGGDGPLSPMLAFTGMAGPAAMASGTAGLASIAIGAAALAARRRRWHRRVSRPARRD